MIDIQIIRDKPEWVSEKSAQKGYPIDINTITSLDKKRRELLSVVESLRAARNDISGRMKDGGRPSEADIAEGRKVKEQLVEQEALLKECEDALQVELKKVPNMPLDEVPIGTTEEENKVVKTWGEKPVFDFAIQSHWQIAEARDLIDKDRAAKVSGSRFAYIKGPLVELQFAILQWVTATLTSEDILQKIISDNNLSVSAKPFVPVLPPAMIRTDAYEAMDRLQPSDDRYRVGTEEDDLWLQGSAEHTLGSMYWNETLTEQQLPIRYLGFLTSFRREAGTYGKDTEGIIRMHQFDKLEMEVFSTAETGYDEHKLLVALQEYMVQQLELPYQLLEKCTFDIGKPNARGIDIEVWMPGQDKYRETHTADYMTDYQARRLATRVKRMSGATELIHTNDATAFALGRIMVAIIENYQTADGGIRVPKVLQTYLGGREVL